MIHNFKISTAHCLFICADNYLQGKNIVKLGETAILTCVTLTNIIWTFNDGSLPANSQKKQNTLVIHNTTRENAGTYECSVAWPSGVTHADIVLHVKGEFLPHALAT